MTVSKKSKYRKDKNASTLIEDAKRIRREMEKQVYKRKDGVLQCPPAYAVGYGIQTAKSGL